MKYLCSPSRLDRKNLPAGGGILRLAHLKLDQESILMNTLNFLCAILLTFVLSLSMCATCLKQFFTCEELSEMGVRIESADLQSIEG